MRSFSSAFIVIQSRSPRSWRANRETSPARTATPWRRTAAVVTRGTGSWRVHLPYRLAELVETLFPECLRARTATCPSAARRASPERIHVCPGVDVEAAHLGLLGTHVFRRADERTDSVWSVRSVSACVVAFATPKSITFGIGRSSRTVTRTFEGFRSRWMIPFWWAC